STLLGALMLTLADMVARVAVAPAELPIGIVTALVGAPFFLYLLFQQKGRIF
ncbi:iron chelate uptake ABC transporter family permease subunit, partial [Klebsiella pneumoniae]